MASESRRKRIVKAIREKVESLIDKHGGVYFLTKAELLAVEGADKSVQKVITSINRSTTEESLIICENVLFPHDGFVRGALLRIRESIDRIHEVHCFIVNKTLFEHLKSLRYSGSEKYKRVMEEIIVYEQAEMEKNDV